MRGKPEDLYKDKNISVSHVHFGQMVNDLEVIDGNISVNIKAKDRMVISYENSFYSGPTLHPFRTYATLFDTRLVRTSSPSKVPSPHIPPTPSPTPAIPTVSTSRYPTSTPTPAQPCSTCSTSSSPPPSTLRSPLSSSRTSRGN